MGRLKSYIEQKQKQLRRGIEVTEQMKAERRRKHRQKVKDMKPGAKKAILSGLEMKKSPLAVMRDEYARRKHEREVKYKK